MTLARWRGVIGRDIPSQGAKSTCNPMFESASNDFLPKEAPFIFLPLTYNGELEKLTWPWVTDIKIPRYTFYTYWYTDINCWKFQGDRSFGVALTSIQTFSEVRSLDVTWWPDLEWPESEIFTTCAEKMYEQTYQKRPLLRYSRKTWRGVPPQAQRGLKLAIIGFLSRATRSFSAKL